MLLSDRLANAARRGGDDGAGRGGRRSMRRREGSDERAKIGFGQKLAQERVDRRRPSFRDDLREPLPRRGDGTLRIGIDPADVDLRMPGSLELLVVLAQLLEELLAWP